MESWILGLFVFLFLASAKTSKARNSASFYSNYYVTWGFDHALIINNETEIQLTLDQTSGSGFETKWRYGSGFFHIRMKIPDKNSTGVLTAFYLTSRSSDHDELDFELLGNDTAPYTLQTNVFANGQGGREQRIHLWFDPTKDFHSYKILWNQYQIVFYVDNVPIRVFKNNRKVGVNYPNQPMQIEGSVWNAEGWASGGKRTDWNQAPFKAYLQEFNADGCVLHDYAVEKCYSSHFWWNREEFWKLKPRDQKAYDHVRTKYMYYDYCSDKTRYSKPPPECKSNQ
ncbi:Glycoside hydrolase family 16 - like 10 [Theobroma cacao]|nr:Glycoside hydrolase family 16 - like 10 [Theobroma cacao]